MNVIRDNIFAVGAAALCVLVGRSLLVSIPKRLHLDRVGERLFAVLASALFGVIGQWSPVIAAVSATFTAFLYVWAQLLSETLADRIATVAANALIVIASGLLALLGYDAAWTLAMAAFGAGVVGSAVLASLAFSLVLLRGERSRPPGLARTMGGGAVAALIVATSAYFDTRVAAVSALLVGANIVFVFDGLGRVAYRSLAAALLLATAFPFAAGVGPPALSTVVARLAATFSHGASRPQIVSLGEAEGNAKLRSPKAADEPHRPAAAAHSRSRFGSRDGSAATSMHDAAGARVLAVLPVRAKDPARAFVDQGYLTEVVRGAALRAFPKASIISRENMLLIASANGRSLEECESDCAVETGRLLGADQIITGEQFRVGRSYRVTLSLHETKGVGRLLSSAIAASNTVELLDAAVEDAVRQLSEMRTVSK